MLLAKDTISEGIKTRRVRATLLQAGKFSPQKSTTVSEIKPVGKRNAAIGVPEHAWVTVHNGLFFPVHPSKQKWDALVMALILYSVILVPFRVGALHFLLFCRREAFGWIFF